MSRKQNAVDQLVKERNTAREAAGEARETAERLRGELLGERRASQAIAQQLAEHAAALGGQAEAARARGHRAAFDAVTLRRSVAEHLDALQQGLDPAAAAAVLQQRLQAHGIDLRAEVQRAAAARIVAAAQQRAAADAGDSAAAVCEVRVRQEQA